MRPDRVDVAEKPSIQSARPARAALPAAVIERIVEAASLVRPQKATQIRIALSPAHLGDLLIELTLSGTLLEGKVVTENEAAKDLLVAHLDQLRQELESQGIQVGDFQVTVDGSFRPGSEDPFGRATGEPEAGRATEPGSPLRSLRSHRIDVTA